MKYFVWDDTFGLGVSCVQGIDQDDSELRKVPEVQEYGNLGELTKGKSCLLLRWSTVKITIFAKTSFVKPKEALDVPEFREISGNP